LRQQQNNNKTIYTTTYAAIYDNNIGNIYNWDNNKTTTRQCIITYTLYKAMDCKNIPNELTSNIKLILYVLKVTGIGFPN